MGGGSIAEVSTNGVRALTVTHDVGQNIVCGTTTVLSLSDSTGAYVNALSVASNCTIDGQLVVGSTNILSALNAAQASSGPVAISGVTGLQAALDAKKRVAHIIIHAAGVRIDMFSAAAG